MVQLEGRGESQLHPAVCLASERREVCRLRRQKEDKKKKEKKTKGEKEVPARRLLSRQQDVLFMLRILSVSVSMSVALSL